MHKKLTFLYIFDSIKCVKEMQEAKCGARSRERREAGEEQYKLKAEAEAAAAQGNAEKNEIERSKAQKVWRSIGYWSFLNFGVLLMALGLHLFEAPNHFALGGVTGISIVLAPYITPYVPWLTQRVILGIINIFLLVLGLIILGKELTLKTLLCTIIYTLEAWLLDRFFPIEKPLTGQPVMELMYAVIVLGTGSAIIFNCNASSGGSDIIALIVKKFTNLNIGVALLTADFVIGLLAFNNGIQIGMLSILGITAKTFVIDGIINNIAANKYVTIITSKPDIAANLILNDIKRGLTKYAATGGYSGEAKTVIMTVCRKNQAMKIKQTLRELDPEAFVIIAQANEIYGKGFK